MVLTPSKIILLVVINTLLFGKIQEANGEGRDFNGYLPPDENKMPEYQVLQYPNNNYPFKEEYAECVRNPMLPLLGKGLNLLLLKLGVFGIIKAVIALILAGFLIKVPIMLMKLALMKSFFLPIFAAPLLFHIFTHHMQHPSDNGSEEKPGETQPEMPGIMGMNEMTADMGRELNDNLTTVAWQSMKMFAESDQCVEKISCMIGASSKDSSMGSVFTRILKYLHHSSPPSIQKRVTSIKEAFNKGSRSSTCLPEEYECQSPELLLQYGMKKIKIL